MKYSCKRKYHLSLLRRLLKEDYLSSYWEDNAEGVPPRKIITVFG